MKNSVLEQLTSCSNNMTTLEREILEIEKIIAEKKILLEQNKGAYSVLLGIAMENGLITEDGKIVKEDAEVEIVGE